MKWFSRFLGWTGIVGQVPEHLDHCEFDCREPECSMERYATCENVWSEAEIREHREKTESR